MAPNPTADMEMIPVKKPASHPTVTLRENTRPGRDYSHVPVTQTGIADGRINYLGSLLQGQQRWARICFLGY